MRIWSPNGHPGLLVAVLATMLGVALAGCEDLSTLGGDAETTEATATTLSEVMSTVTVPVATVPSVPPTTLASTEERLPNGHITSLGIIDNVWEDSRGRHLSIDYCSVVTGDEATAAARRDGLIGPTEIWETDYYLDNQSTRLREWAISDSVQITTTYRYLLVDPEGSPCTWADFLSFWGPGPLPDGEDSMRDSLWVIERDGNTVVSILQQFMP